MEGWRGGLYNSIEARTGTVIEFTSVEFKLCIPNSVEYRKLQTLRVYSLGSSYFRKECSEF